MTDAPEITQELVRQRFEYRDGKLVWRLNPSKDGRFNRYAGTEVRGSADRDGYLRVSVHLNDGRQHTCRIHRLVYLMHHGKFPEIVDHINGVVTDNRIENLRAATVSQNSSNKRLSPRSTTGVEGVRLRHNGRYQVQLQINNRTIYRGHYATLEEAAAESMRLRKEVRGEWQREEAYHY